MKGSEQGQERWGWGISWPGVVLGDLAVTGRSEEVEWKCRAGGVWARSEGSFQPTPCRPHPKALLGPGVPSRKTLSLASFVESYSGVCGTSKREDFKW